MTYEEWRKKVLEKPGAAERVAKIEKELLLAVDNYASTKKVKRG